MAAPDDSQLVLASASPRRQALLETLGIRVRRLPVDLDESPRAGEAPEALVRRLAEDKARAGFALDGSGLPALGADTLVVLDGRTLGKPVDREAALAMLAALSGRAHAVLSAVAVATASGVQVRVSHSIVEFRDIPAEEAQRYWDTGEPRDKAGAYGIQGVGGIFVTRLDGSFSGVMGLPVAETEMLLRDAGIDCWRHRIDGAAGDGPAAGDPARALQR